MTTWMQWMMLWSWQCLFVVAALFVVVRAGRFASAAERHRWWLLGVLLIALLPAANAAVRLLPALPPSVQQIADVAQLPVMMEADGPIPGPAAGHAPGPETASGASLAGKTLFGAWAIGFLASLVQSSRSYWTWRQLRAAARHVNAAAGIESIPIGYCPGVRSPVLAGFLRPIILLPADISEWMTTTELRAVVLHEKAHFDRGDHLVNPLQNVLRAIFFFHPAVRYALRQFVLERELACDERVLLAGANPTAYADALLKVAERGIAQRHSYQPAFNTSGRILDRRVRMILNHKTSTLSSSWFWTVARTGALVALVVLLLPERAVTLAEPAPPAAATAAQAPTAPPAEAPRPEAAQPSTLSGRISDLDGRPIPGVEVELLSRAGKVMNVVLTSKDGSYRFPAVDSGEYVLGTRMPGFTLGVVAVLIPPQTARTQDITIEPSTRRVAALVSTTAPAQAVAQAQTAALSGTISDQSGAVIPGVTVTLSPSGGGNGQTAISNVRGAFAFPAASPGDYVLEARLPGFTTYRRTTTLRSGTAPVLAVILQMAGTATQIEVSASKPPTAAPVTASPGVPTRVGGAISAPTLINAARPVYPPGARARQVQDYVVLLGVVGVDGRVLSLRVDPTQGSGNLELIQAAMDAVRQWQYRPALLNGAPVEFPTTVTINFTLVD